MSWARIEPKRTSPGGRHCHSSLCWKNRVYIFGGTNGKDKFNDVHYIDIARNSWTKVRTTGGQPSPRYCAAIGLYKDNMIVFGGYDGTRTNSVYSLNLETGNWTTMIPNPGSTVPLPRSHHSLSIIGSHMYIFGGLSEDAKLLCDLHVFDLEKLIWKSLQPHGTSPSGRINHSAHIIGNSFLVFGGYDGKLRLNDVYLLNLETLTWNEPLIHGTPPSRRLGQASVVAGDKFLVFGGDDGNKDRALLNDVHIFDLASMSWIIPEIGGYAPPSGRTHASACVANENQVWIIAGGNSQKVKLDDVYKLELSGLYIFQQMLLEHNSLSITKNIEECWHKLQIMTNLSSHLFGINSKRFASPTKKRSVEAPSSSSNNSLTASATLSRDSAADAEDGLLDLSRIDSKKRSTRGRSETKEAKEPKDPRDYKDIREPKDKDTKDKDAKERGESRERSESKQISLNTSASQIDSEQEKVASKKARRKGMQIRQSERRDVSPPPFPYSPNELSPATSPRGEFIHHVMSDDEDERIDKLEKIDTNFSSVSFALDSDSSGESFSDEPEVVQRAKRSLSVLKQHFNQLILEKDEFIKDRQARVALIEAAGTRDITHANEIAHLRHKQNTKVVLNVGGILYTTSIATLTSQSDSMLAAMFSGRHPLVPEDDGTYFIDRDGTYFRYILNYLRCGSDVVLEAKPSVLAEILVEARFFQLEGLKDTILSILSDPTIREEPIVEY